LCFTSGQNTDRPVLCRREFHIFSFRILYHHNATEFEDSQLELRQRAPKWLTPAKDLFLPRGGVVFWLWR
jgi:hypothetical protein